MHFIRLWLSRIASFGSIKYNNTNQFVRTSFIYYYYRRWERRRSIDYRDVINGDVSGKKRDVSRAIAYYYNSDGVGGATTNARVPLYYHCSTYGRRAFYRSRRRLVKNRNRLFLSIHWQCRSTDDVWGGEGSQSARRGLEMRQCRKGAVGYYSGEKECAFIATRRKRRLGGGENGENAA